MHVFWKGTQSLCHEILKCPILKRVMLHSLTCLCQHSERSQEPGGAIVPKERFWHWGLWEISLAVSSVPCPLTVPHGCKGKRPFPFCRWEMAPEVLCPSYWTEAGAEIIPGFNDTISKTFRLGFCDSQTNCTASLVPLALSVAQAVNAAGLGKLSSCFSLVIPLLQELELWRTLPVLCLQLSAVHGISSTDGTFRTSELSCHSKPHETPVVDTQEELCCKGPGREQLQDRSSAVRMLLEMSVLFWLPFGSRSCCVNSTAANVQKERVFVSHVLLS